MTCTLGSDAPPCFACQKKTSGCDLDNTENELEDIVTDVGRRGAERPSMAWTLASMDWGARPLLRHPIFVFDTFELHAKSQCPQTEKGGHCTS